MLPWKILKSKILKNATSSIFWIYFWDIYNINDQNSKGKIKHHDIMESPAVSEDEYCSGYQHTFSSSSWNRISWSAFVFLFCQFVCLQRPGMHFGRFLSIVVDLGILG